LTLVFRLRRDVTRPLLGNCRACRASASLMAPLQLRRHGVTSLN
jgi:hypothetical protein